MTPQAARPEPRRPDRRAGLALAGLALAVLVLAAGFAARADGRVHITVLDVGQGDAILVEGDAGSRLLIDGGPDPDRLIVLLDARFPPWDRRIDVLILSHPHEDHAGGLPKLVERYRIGRIYEPGMLGPGPAYHAFRSDLAFRARTPGILSTGDRLQVDSIAFRVLWPDRDAVSRLPANGGTAINNVSIVLLGTFDGQRFLLAGDIEQEIDPILLARGLPRVDLLKVAHHGSRTSSTGAFLDAVRPRVAIVSVGAVNPYGHPAPETLARIEARGARLYRTDRNGSVEAILDGRSIAVQAEHGGPALAAAPQTAPESAGVAAAATAGSTAVRAQGPLATPASVGAGSFRCGIVPIAFGAVNPEPAARPDRSFAVAGDGLYHRVDVHPVPNRGDPAPALAVAVGPCPASRPGGRGSGRLAGTPDRPARNPDQSRGRGSRGPAPRHRQGSAQAPAPGRSPARPAPW
jgi:competence protein ComEC